MLFLRVGRTKSHRNRCGMEEIHFKFINHSVKLPLRQAAEIFGANTSILNSKARNVVYEWMKHDPEVNSTFIDLVNAH